MKRMSRDKSLIRDFSSIEELKDKWLINALSVVVEEVD